MKRPRLSPHATFWLVTVAVFVALSGSVHVGMWIFHRHRTEWTDALAGLAEGFAAGLIGRHFERRAEARDRSTS